LQTDLSSRSSKGRRGVPILIRKCAKLNFVRYLDAMSTRQSAEKAVNPVGKEARLRLASEWLKLAEGAASRQK